MDPVLLLLVVASAVALAAIGIALSARTRLRAVEERFAVLWGDGAGDVATVLARQAGVAKEQEHQMTRLREQVEAVQAEGRLALKHVAVVRYDAFGDTGGRLSFSAALLDDHGDGIVISSIHARGEARTYAKGIEDGSSCDATLTPEEQQALAAARRGATR